MDRTTLKTTIAGTGESRVSDSRWTGSESLTLLPSTAFGDGITKGSTFDANGKSNIALTLAVSAKSGTNPTLDVAVQTSPDGDVWRTLGTFTQRTDVGYAMSAVSETGTTPPDITLSGTPVRPINLKVICTKLGNRGTSEIKYSLDGGVTYSAAIVTAATIEMLDEYGVSTGVTLNLEDAASAVNNVWTASTVGWERKCFGGLDRYVRAVATVGGSNTPIMTASLSGFVV